ncbi:MAG: DDE-type integrase/transposase/recombinase [Myxococcales bacterium]|nr:DDE-type integrase/transposase/recombinase [Myxococcales bacterium]
MSSRPTRGPSAERRSFITEHAGDLCIGDALYGPLVLAAGGRLKKTILFSELDCATRYVIESRFVIARGERPEDHELGLKNALLKAGLFRTYYVDRGPAYRAGSLRAITAELGIRLLFTGAGDAEAKGAIERYNRTWREEVGDELGDRVLTLNGSQAYHWAWLEQEYHARKHDTTGRAPREHWLAEVAAGHLRPLPRGLDLDAVFLHRATRHVRDDGVLSFRGQLLEVRAEPQRPASRAALRAIRADRVAEGLRRRALLLRHSAARPLPERDTPSPPGSRHSGAAGATERHRSARAHRP